jgi:hypothetical protein
MESRQPVANPSSAFDDFLFAVICEERDGTQLSVLSALARTDVDPWEEAARLSTLTIGAAEETVVALIGRVMHDGTPAQNAAIAERLVRLLPKQHAATQSGSSVLSRAVKAPDLSTQALIFLVGWWSFVMVVSAFTPNKATVGADAPPAYTSTRVLPRDSHPEGPAVIRDGFPYSNVGASR